MKIEYITINKIGWVAKVDDKTAEIMGSSYIQLPYTPNATQQQIEQAYPGITVY